MLFREDGEEVAAVCARDGWGGRIVPTSGMTEEELEEMEERWERGKYESVIILAGSETGESLDGWPKAGKDSFVGDISAADVGGCSQEGTDSILESQSTSQKSDAS